MSYFMALNINNFTLNLIFHSAKEKRGEKNEKLTVYFNNLYPDPDPLTFDDDVMM